MTQLNRLIGDRSAARDGVLMFRDGGVVVSVDGEWVELAGAVLRSPDGNGWRLSVSNAGALTAVPA